MQNEQAHRAGSQQHARNIEASSDFGKHLGQRYGRDVIPARTTQHGHSKALQLSIDEKLHRLPQRLTSPLDLTAVVGGKKSVPRLL